MNKIRITEYTKEYNRLTFYYHRMPEYKYLIILERGSENNLNLKWASSDATYYIAPIMFIGRSACARLKIYE